MVFLSATFMIGGAIWYSVKISAGKVDPPPATWLILTWSISLSMVMYMEDPNWSITGNIGLKASRRIPVFNAEIECRLLRYQMWKGSRRPPLRPAG